MLVSNVDELFDKLPLFFVVDGTPVKLVEEGDEVAGYTANGFPFAVFKALNEGREVSEEEFNSVASSLSAQA